MRAKRQTILAAIGVLVAALAVGHAQFQRPKASVAPLVESDGIHAATIVRAALQVSLPEGLHVQSNQPRDPSLIPTILTIDPPAGVSVAEIVYPATTDLKQIGADQPLSVFEHDFVVGVRFSIAPGTAPGDLLVPAHLRYQACDAQVCYPPATADASWTLRVVPAATSISTGQADLLDRIPFGKGQAPSSSAAVTARSREGLSAADSGLAQLDDFVVLGTTGGYLGSTDFLRFVHNAEMGVTERGLLEGRGPLAILLIVFLGGLALNLTPCVLPMIPINLAIIGAGARAGSRSRGFLLGAAYGGAMALVYGILGVIVILTAGTFGTINASPWFNLGITVLFVILAAYAA